ncbi:MULTISPECIES: expansin EXLX1 family cellulose-binding protein [Clostridium]|uniref:Extracellular endoglucanase n=1 Tax=Clostridium saccharoperbutylacetonicum N1-4(HMT) TaxID=931276 RepID=M1MIZ5_9CLOT|nr:MULTISPECIES: expansin EXLX1 family cellulose-binding protein [Clostridium]AGF56283.1 extracellular endoglucanase [Clostridium saccharoperbutylacetonicum N1-4(HMT)]AQR95023.1 expansin-YoaJ precursor [Clostridium saccharoperbutylacetonicum]NRT62974.1 expansin (peptidoglycan-binding protein) [Clostridium saccharoperbutylacetonicum]NSB26331.1 expansin (peptidoglycan-binding protein) [Clostridium saccharoperbutylacetonicum]NSB30867.1 expansin (peptidoglycan-binding protein) [Clostridium sacchar
MKKSSLKRKFIVSTVVAMNLLFCSSIQAFAAWNDNHSSYATYTGSGYSGGAALLDPISPKMEITALDPADFNYNGINAALAGAYLEVQGPKGKTTVYVTDLYPEGANGALDLCPTSFAKIGNMSAGKINISWHIVKAPITGMCSYRIKEGSNPNWAAIQVRNHKYPVVKMEFLKNNTWINMTKMPYNHFVGNGMGTGSIKIRITDIRGIAVTDTIPALPQYGNSSAYIIPGHVQLPD